METAWGGAPPAPRRARHAEGMSTFRRRLPRSAAAARITAALLALALVGVALLGASAGATAHADVGTGQAAAPLPADRMGEPPGHPAGSSRTAGTDMALVRGGWAWPLTGRHVLARAFLAPPHAYGPGHRGVDLRADAGDATATESVEVLAPGDGVIAFAGDVANRPLVTIDHGDGLVSTLEPVRSLVEVGQRVRRGMPIGTLAAGGHARPGSLHLGARLLGEYVNPLRFLGGMARARLLPLR